MNFLKAYQNQTMDHENTGWWNQAAWDAIHRGHVQWIPTRRGDQLYLGRFWLTPPMPSRTDEGRFESADSVLLHYFAQGDDDGALHDHPWAFKSSVLAGGYMERRPSMGWRFDRMPQARTNPQVMGVSFDDCDSYLCVANAGEIYRRAHDQHAVEQTQPGTWTLVRTGHREGPWGFHPPGRPWTPWRTFLQEKSGRIERAAHGH